MENVLRCEKNLPIVPFNIHKGVYDRGYVEKNQCTFYIAGHCYFAWIYIWNFYVTLSENKSISKALGDFTLHVRVNGVEVMHLKDSVEIQHQNPLVSVSLLNAKHDFTGSYVTKPMEERDIYHSQKADILSSLNKNES